jgi:hypothetical protein
MGGRKLWESKDEKLWVHDLFDELITRDESFSAEVGFALKLRCKSYHMQKDSDFKLLSIMRSQFYLQVYEQQHAPFITGNLFN